MKKRLLSALLALALVFVLLPTTALAETPAIKIAGTVIEDGKYYYTNGGIGELKTEAQQKTWNVRREGNTLYLRNANIKTDTQSIQVWMMSVTINLEGDSAIKTKGEGSIVSQHAGSLTINGNGKLTIESNTAGSSIVWNSGDVTITGDAVVNITNKNSGQLSDAIGLASSYELTVSENAKLRAVSNGSKAATVNGKKLTIADNAEFNVINQNSSGKAVSFKSIEVATGYDCNGINGNGITEWTKTTAEELNTFQKVLVKPTPAPALEESTAVVAGTKLYKNTAYTIKEGKPVIGGTYPDNYNIYLDTTGSNYVLYVNNADIQATGYVYGITGVSDIVFKGENKITTQFYGIYSYFTQSDLKISGTGFLTVTTYAGNSAIATDYHTSRSIIISGKDFTVTADTSRTNVSAIYSDKGGLTIKDGATVKAISANNSRAIRIGGSLTVTDATLTATSTSDKKPIIEVEGNASFTGSTVTITNYSTTQGERYKDSYEVSSALHVDGDITISGGTVAATATAGGDAIRAVGNITVSNDATVTAQNNSQYFSAITAGRATSGEVNTLYKLIVSGENTSITATNTHDNNLTYGGAINAYIENANEGYYLQVGTDTKAIAPNDSTTVRSNSLTITRGDAYVAPTKTITEIIVTGLTPPVKGATPVDKNNVTLTEGLTVESITWGPDLTSDGKFAADTSYTAHIKYSVNAGYELAANASYPQVDGANVTRWHQEGMPQDEIEVTFPKTAADTPTEKPTITLDLPAPVAGVAPVTTGVTATSSDNTPLTIDKVEWYAYTVEYNNGKFERIVEGDKVSGNFEANTYYSAEITFDRSISFANGGLNITAPTWPLEGSWPESCIYRVIENSYTARILFPATGAPCNHQPGDWQDGTDGEHHVKVCAICHNVVATESHAFGGYQINTNNSHTRVCSVCNAAYTNAHEFNSYAHNENSHWKVCVCGATTSYANHEFDPATGACACGATQSGGNPTPDVPAAPTGLAGVAPTSANSKDGKITGTTAAMEYATEPNGSNWIECGGDEVTGLSAGTYYVRYKRTTDKPASAVATVVVPAYSGGGEIVPPTPDNPGTIVIIRPAEEEKPAQQPNPSTGANDLVGLAVAAAVAAALGSAALLRKHD